MTSKLDVFLKDVKSATAKADAADAEVAPQLLELLLVLGNEEVAQLDEVAA